jgi:isoleucyl-tRNA synthetase
MTDGYVTDDSGTGIVHQAPAFGEDDFRVCMSHGVIAKGELVPCPVDEAGCFTAEVVDFVGQHVKVIVGLMLTSLIATRKRISTS